MKGTKVHIGGKDRVFRFDLNSIGDLGDKLGIMVRPAHIVEDLLERAYPLSAIKTFVWAALIHAEPDLDEREVGSWVDLEENGREVAEAFFGAFTAIFSGPAGVLRGLAIEHEEEEEAVTTTV
jgi:hypothetical protein